MVVQFSASRDKQTAADTNALSGAAHTGAATYAFIQAVEALGPTASYGALLASMKATLDSVNGGGAAGLGLPSGGGGVFGKLMSGVLDAAGMSGQTPVMCTNVAFDIWSPLAL